MSVRSGLATINAGSCSRRVRTSLRSPSIVSSQGRILCVRPFVAFIDNITFHPVPEPGTLALLAFGLATLVIARRRMM